MGDDNIRVCCRFRPVNKRELEEEKDGRFGHIQGPLFNFLSDDKSVRVRNFEKGNREEDFSFDRIFSKGSTLQTEVYEYVAKQTVNDVLKGYNGTIFAYGQTGAGKTHSMFGPKNGDDNLRGIIPRACRHIFEHMVSDTMEGREWAVKCSFMEIYRENVRDLLSPTGENLKTRETPGRGVWVEGLTEHYVGSEEEVLHYISLGETFRSVSATKMNEVSSRSHSLFVLTVSQKFPNGSTKSGRLNLADLAGSEKVGKTGARGDSLEEAKKINQSLSALGNCIHSLSEAKKGGHIPYRDSKLTHVLKESLGGNTKTTLVICCSPHPFNIEETLSTLRFAARAKAVKNTATVNEKRSVEQLEALLEKLTKKYKSRQKYAGLLLEELVSLGVSLEDISQQEESPSSPSFSSSPSSSLTTPSLPSEQGGSQEGGKRRERKGTVNEGFREKTKRITEILSTLREEIADKQTIIEEMKESNQQLSTQAEELTRERERVEEEREVERAETAKWRFSVEQALGDVESHKRAEEEVQTAIQTISSQIQEYTAQQAQLEQEIRDLEEEKKKREEEKEKMKCYRQKIDERREFLDKANEEIEAVQLKKNYIQSKKEAVEALKRRVLLYDEVRQRKEELEKAVAEKEALISETQLKLSDIETANEMECQKWRAEANSLQKKEEDLNLELAELQDKYDDLLSVHSSLDSEVKTRYTDDMKQIETGEVSQRAEREKERAEKQGECEKLKKDALEKTAELGALKRQIISEADQLEKEKRETATLEKQLEMKGEVKKADEREAEILIKELEVCKEDLENKSKEGQNIEEEEREKRAKLQTKQEKTGELAKKKQEKELGVWERVKESNQNSEKEEEIARNIKKNQNQLAHLMQKKDRMKEREKELKDRNDDLVAKNERLKQQIEEQKQRQLEFSEKQKQQEAVVKEMTTQKHRQGAITKPVVVNRQKKGEVFTPNRRGSGIVRINSINFRAREGWLVKEGGIVRSWKKRYFILSTNSIPYFKNAAETDTNLGTIILTPESSAELVNESTNLGWDASYPPNTFAICHPTQRTFFLQAESKEEAQLWIDDINRQIDHLSKPNPTRVKRSLSFSLDEKLVVNVAAVPGVIEAQILNIPYVEGMLTVDLKKEIIATLQGLCQPAKVDELLTGLTKFCVVQNIEAASSTDSPVTNLRNEMSGSGSVLPNIFPSPKPKRSSTPNLHSTLNPSSSSSSPSPSSPSPSSKRSDIRVMLQKEEVNPLSSFGFREVMAHLHFQIKYPKGEVKIGQAVPVHIIVTDPVSGNRQVESHNGELLIEVNGPLSSSSSSSSSPFRRPTSAMFVRKQSLSEFEAQKKTELFPTFPDQQPGSFSANVVLNMEGLYHFRVVFNGYEVQMGPAIIMISQAKKFGIFGEL